MAEMKPLFVNTLYTLASGPQAGAYNMALDEWLLEAVCQQHTKTVLIVRTYQWETPTLSLGVHQAEKDLPRLMALYSQTPNLALVRRPTGGRAILHGDDISFSFISNHPDLLRRSIADSYCELIRPIKQTLLNLDVPLEDCGESDTRAYTRSPVCFETSTPSDLTDRAGKKRVGSSQLRRAGGLLQHGAVFFDATEAEAKTRFTETLFQTVAETLGVSAQTYPLPESSPELNAMVLRYEREASEILASGILESARITSGSHFVPASS